MCPSGFGLRAAACPRVVQWALVPDLLQGELKVWTLMCSLGSGSSKAMGQALLSQGQINSVNSDVLHWALVPDLLQGQLKVWTLMCLLGSGSYKAKGCCPRVKSECGLGCVHYALGQ